MRHIKTILTLLAISLCLVGCFHLRDAENFPIELKTLYLTTDNVFSEITSELSRQLQASHVVLVDSPQQAPLTIKLSNSRTSTDIPIVFDSALATIYSYNISVTVELIYRINHQDKVLLKTTVNAHQNIVHSVNQISSPVITPLMRRTLTQRLVNSIYNILSSKNVVDHINTLKKVNGNIEK